MRLHHLSMTAFGPFAGTEQVDFDSLNGAGLFLLSGATGAGKSSILDAVCFALYGTVPGARGVKVLKSQHAGDRTAPEVLLDFSVRDRRFVVRRSPEWSRPKLRGSGMRTEKAAASLSEMTPDGERLVSHRAAEVGLAVSELIGMQASQFQQVAMLPQGEFQRFLQATTADRHDVLQHLFRTARFARIEDWVQEHSRRLRDESAAGGQAVERLLATIADRAGVELPTGFADRLDAGTALTWAGEQVAGAAQELDDAKSAHAAAVRQVETCRSELERRRTTADRVRRRDDARARLRVLADQSVEAAELRADLDADAAASGCLPVLALLDRAAADLADAAAERDRRLELVRRSASDTPDDLGEPDSVDLAGDLVPSAEQLADVERATRVRLARVEAALPAVRALETDRAALDEVERALEQASAEQSRLAQDQEALPARRREAEEHLGAVRAAAAGVEVLQLKLEAARDRTQAAQAIGAVRRRLLDQQDTLRDARDAAADARDLVQTLTQRRLDGYAAELAGTLQEGSACQVCGSTEHPDPAVASAGQVSAEEQQRAQQSLDEATARVEMVTAEANRLDQELTGLHRRADGRDAHTSQAEQQAVDQELADARQAAADQPELEQRLEHLLAEVERCRTAAGEADVRVARLAEAVRTRRQSIDDARAALADMVPGVREPAELGRQAKLLTARLEAVQALLSAQARHEEAAGRVGELQTDAATAAVAAGFSAVSGVRESLLTDTERARAQQLLDERAHAVAAAEAVLADPDISSVGDSASPDVRAAELALLEADTEAQRLARDMHQLEQRASALQTQAERLTQQLGQWAPALQEAEQAESMSKLVRGLGGDNQLQMRLSAYVLATRLDQVLAAANERLSHMRDQRYVLQRTARAHRKGTQAGLGLEMLDQWTGDTRDPATLSGGETFVVSLALALGLADVVTQEAGGTEIETLFVDEGFGTLDADTLDDVMDRLDALRAGGRSVGVVSHVTELRSRIPTQLHVHKTPTGSSIRMT